VKSLHQDNSMQTSHFYHVWELKA